MPGVFEEIVSWAETLPFWEQAALNKIIAGEQITEDFIDELTDYLLEDAELQEPQRERPALCHLAPQAVNPLIGDCTRVQLRRLSNLKSINALVENQVLEFGPQLTAIFGANGSGKSGYARVIASSAFTRGDRQILPNVITAQTSTGPMEVDIDLEIIDLKTKKRHPITIHYKVGETCPQLKSFYVFDSTSAKNHLTRENPMSFAPAGLEIITRLSALTDQVRKNLDKRCGEKNCLNHSFEALFQGDSSIREMISNLGAATDIQALRNMAQVTGKDRKQVDELELQIAELRNEKVQEQIQEIVQEIKDLEQLIKSLNLITDTVNGDASQVENLISDWQSSCQLVDSAGSEGLESSHFPQIGTGAWRSFIVAAYQLGQAEKPEYPLDGDHCLLCHQPLSSNARGVISRVWEIVTSQAQDNLVKVEAELRQYSEEFDDIDFTIFDESTVSYRYLQQNHPPVFSETQKYIEVYRKYRDALMGSIARYSVDHYPPISTDVTDALRSIIDQLHQEKRHLEEKNIEAEIQQLDKQLHELRHRMVLSEALDEIIDFVERTKWVQEANKPKVKRSTRHITRIFDDMFDRLVTQEYIQLFQDTLRDLKCPMRVKISTRGEKGETHKQIIMVREDNQAAEASPDAVLSEGEQRAVALADFLTEVALDKNSCGILLDDPVTSLDFEWKETIAKHIALEAKRQQVILFTHDLHFLYCIKTFAKDESIALESHWIQKRNEIPGWVFLGNSPAAEKDFKDSKKAKEWLQKTDAPDLSAEDEAHCLESGFGALRTSYEAFIMYELFGDVVSRFAERISTDRLKNVYFDESIRDEIIKSTGRLSRYITAHSHSDKYVAQKPTIAMLEDEIKKFDELKNRLKQLKKEHVIKN